MIAGIAFMPPAESEPSAAHGKMNVQLRFQRDMREAPMKSLSPQRSMLGAVGGDRAIATVKFDHVLSASGLNVVGGVEDPGHRLDGKIARTRAIYPVNVPWDEIDGLGARREVLRLESNWKPAVYPALDVSVPEIEADSVWAYDDPLGLPITGR